MYVFKFDKDIKAPPETSLIPKIKDDFLARILSIIFFIDALFEFLSFVYSYSNPWSRIEHFAVFLLCTACMCFLAAGVVKGKKSRIFLALVCQFLILLRCMFWFVVLFISLIGFVFAWSGGFYYFSWWWWMWWMFWMLFRILLLVLLWRLHKNIRGPMLLPVSTSAAPSSE
ncbi:hypothetical protein PFISCL1PPCAC_22695 [Pristionchus fissidentatus]|uniref:Transmembrane protein n=1 Tax=Pristionchus fissidentatus TaxID=1538716 RepID=A0AAV5WIZ3_9BILA|nr:hypothetical protein PFISCL1PPCAC_22695 [Pristionchus fissidentatus]